MVSWLSGPLWLARIQRAWNEAPTAWLSGVRRSGKTTLVQSLGTERTLYVNCDVPAVEDMVRDPPRAGPDVALAPAGYTRRVAPSRRLAWLGPPGARCGCERSVSWRWH